MKKVVACVIVCCILLCLFAACGKAETYMELYVSGEIPKNTIIKQDTNNKILKIEEGENFSWICTVSKKTWDTYFNMATEQFRKDIIKYLNQEIHPSFINIVNYKINEDFSEAEIYVDLMITHGYWISMNDFSAATIEIKSAGKQFRYTLFGDYNFDCKIYFSILNKNILE